MIFVDDYLILAGTFNGIKVYTCKDVPKDSLLFICKDKLMVVYGGGEKPMLKTVLMQLVPLFLSLLTPDLLKNFADTLLDWIEDYVTGTASTVDDAIVLPMCEMIRNAFNIPDED